MRKFFALLSVLLFTAASVCAQYETVQTDTLATVFEEDRGMQEDVPFGAITQTQPVQTRTVPAEKVETLKKSDDYWYANLEPQKEPSKTASQTPERRRSLFRQNWFQNLLWIVILCCFIGVVIWYLASSNVRLFRRESKKIVDEEDAADPGDDIFSIQYEKEIARALADKNYRLAVRLWYLKTLKELADRNVIAYRHEKPDSEYVTALHGSRYYRDFFRLTRNFEYTWYGGFNISAEAYELMQADFVNFKNSLS